MPEKYFPGHLDLIGNGHHLFHVLIIYTTVLQFQAGYSDLKQRIHHEVNFIYPGHVFIFGSIALTIVIDTFAIMCLRKKVKERI